jgi:hypothetical protein
VSWKEVGMFQTNEPHFSASSLPNLVFILTSSGIRSAAFVMFVQEACFCLVQH